MNARKNDVLTLTNSNGAITHTDADGNTVAAIAIGHLERICLHVYGVNGHTIKVWGSNESKPTDETNAVQLGDDIAADALVIIEAGPLWLIIETDAAGTGTPTAILTGKVV